MIFGVGGPLVIGLGGLAIGIFFMIAQNWNNPEFFKRKREVADPHVLTGDAPPPTPVTP